jgi:hypothetical protein
MKSFKDQIVHFSVNHVKSVTLIMAVFTLICGAFIPLIKVDTDPENMLSADEPVRLFHNETKKQFDLSDMLVLGVINEDNEYGVFNPETLGRIYELTQFAKTLNHLDKDDPDKLAGVIEVDMIAPSLVDHIGQGGPGVITFEWLMPQPPKTQQEALDIRDKALSNPMLKGTMVSEDGKALMLFIPLTDKHLSYRVYSELNLRIPIIKLWLQMQKDVVTETSTEEQRDALRGLARLLAYNASDLKSFYRDYKGFHTVLFGGWDERGDSKKIIYRALEDFNEKTAQNTPKDSVIDTLIAKINTTATVEQNAGPEGLYKIFAQAYLNSLYTREISSTDIVPSLKQFADNLGEKLVKAKEAMEYGTLVKYETGLWEKELTQDKEQYHITGLPVAEDTFGVEMFIQMAVSAPLAMLTIFILMLIFFRKLVLVISPMIIAMVAVISTMGLLIAFGYSVHIMSSMIPIFLMPIAVVDSVHILSEFFDVYTKEKGRKASIQEVMSTLFTPMLYTSLTSAAGFLSLALTPIPPVQVFGIFVASGIMIAWLFTVTFVPAYIMMIPEKRLAGFGMAVHHEDKPSTMTQILHRAGTFTYRYARLILVVLMVLTGVAIWGITKIQINDNPVKWFSKGHPIRQADMALNEHFGGTYMAYLVLEAETGQPQANAPETSLLADVTAKLDTLQPQYPKIAVVKEQLSALDSRDLQTLIAAASAALDAVPQDDDDLFYAWEEVLNYLNTYSGEPKTAEPFKQPQALRYMAGLQKHLEDAGLVGKSSSLADIVKKVHQELIDGSQVAFRIPDNKQMVSESLIQYQQSHRPQDLWHMTTPDFSHVTIWMQLTSGDNKDMEKVIEAVDAYIVDNPPPLAMAHRWAGLTYINTVWQNKMVFGMLQSFLGSFLVVFIMMSILFRSPLWGLLCMVPLTITIAAIYGTIGFIGKDYDMPVAVLSALTLGMAVDFAIHFLQRSRTVYAQTGSWQTAAGEMFGEPARAISRNVLVIAIGFLPLLAAPLMPYKTVGIFLCAIMAVSGLVTLLALPAVLSAAEKWFFRKSKKVESVGCNCGFCLIIAVSVTVLIALNLHQYWQVGATTLTWISLGLIPVLILICSLLSRRQACKLLTEKKESEE